MSFASSKGLNDIAAVRFHLLN